MDAATGLALVVNDVKSRVQGTNPRFKIKGQPMRDSGALWMVTLQKGASGWRITEGSAGPGEDEAAETASGN